MSRAHHILVLDPVAYRGGSKVVGEMVLAPALADGAKVTVITPDADSWTDVATHRLRPWTVKALATRSAGIPFFVRQLLVSLTVIFAALRFGRIDVAMGISGPGPDLPLYFARWVLGFRLVQLVQGPVAPSRTNGRCLLRAAHLFYLGSTREDIRRAIERVAPATRAEAVLASAHCQELRNGLAEHHWPSACSDESARVFWAASLLEWKRLDLLVEALASLDDDTRPSATVCYIRPKDTSLATCEAPVPIPGIDWFESPPDLDRHRAGCGIFVSTARREPFGLSILEAMAAGLAVIIPADGAMWDQLLEDGVHCRKFRPDDAADLARCMVELASDAGHRRTIGAAGREVAEDYRAERAYQGVATALSADPGARAEGAAR